MNKRATVVFGFAVALAVGIGCKSSQNKPGATPNGSERSQGFSKDDKSRCEYQGRTDRDVSEATAAGAMAPNIRRVYQIIGEGSDRRKVLVCREVDTNLDGVKDVMRVFNEKGEAVREESDTNFDGKIDSWVTFANGRVAKQELDTNGDGKPDVVKFYTNGQLSRVQRDTNGDGQPDIWEIYVRGQLERVGVDTDRDGHVDRWDRDEVARAATATKEAEDTTKASKTSDSSSSASSSASASPASSASAAAPAAGSAAPASSH